MPQNLLHHHPSGEVREAAVKLMDALSQRERSTGEDFLVIIKTVGDYEYRSLGGGPAHDLQTDEELLEAFAGIEEERRAKALFRQRK